MGISKHTPLCAFLVVTTLYTLAAQFGNCWTVFRMDVNARATRTEIPRAMDLNGDYVTGGNYACETFKTVSYC